MPAPPKVFVSYSHRDTKWLERLQVHLKPLEDKGMLTLWDDTKIKPGADWKTEIEQALADAKVAILLISADFLASDYIQNEELHPLLGAAKEKGLLILSVMVSSCHFERVESLATIQAVHDPKQPLIDLEPGEQEKIYVRVVKEVVKALHGIGEPAGQPWQAEQASPPPVPDPAPGQEHAPEDSRSDASSPQTALPETWTNIRGMAFAPIPAGTFIMGSEDGRDNEKPMHEVKISAPFCMGKHVVTQENWRAVMGTAPWTGQRKVESRADHPAVYVSWRCAQEFIDKLNALDDVHHYRLPTEAEWEYAARAGTADRASFLGEGTSLRDYAWYEENAFDLGEQYAHLVMQKRSNAWGLYDVLGNVWEWVEDRYEKKYPSRAETDPHGPQEGNERVRRGGSFLSPADDVRLACRGRDTPGSCASYVGFRLVMDVADGNGADE